MGFYSTAAGTCNRFFVCVCVCMFAGQKNVNVTVFLITAQTLCPQDYSRTDFNFKNKSGNVKYAQAESL